MDNELGAIAYRVLFGDDQNEPLPDPNDETNIPRINAMQKLKIKETQHFWKGPGKVLMDRWQERIRTNVYDLFAAPDEECACKTCSKIREITAILRLLSEAEFILTQK